MSFFQILYYGINTVNLLSMINSLQIELKDPATAAKYTEMQQKLDKLSNIVIISLLYVTNFSYTAPAFIATVINYFILDLGEESFLFSTIISYVFQILHASYQILI